jgi:uncharacterized protein YndB with AHSA1/START domain
MMPETRSERRVAAPPAVVWKVLADFARIAEWTPEVDHSSYMTGQNEGVGTSRRVQVGSMVIVETITEWDPEHRLAYELIGLPPVLSQVVNAWEIEADGDGSRVVIIGDITPGPRPPMRLAAKAVARRFGSTNEKLLAGLAAAAEEAAR